jgi:hypothetical protein
VVPRYLTVVPPFAKITAAVSGANNAVVIAVNKRNVHQNWNIMDTLAPCNSFLADLYAGGIFTIKTSIAEAAHKDTNTDINTEDIDISFPVHFSYPRKDDLFCSKKRLPHSGDS